MTPPRRKQGRQVPVLPPADPTLRELRSTLGRLWHEIDNHGRDTELGRFFRRAYDHMTFVLDAYLFDVDPDADDGGRS